GRTERQLSGRVQALASARPGALRGTGEHSRSRRLSVPGHVRADRRHPCGPPGERAALGLSPAVLPDAHPARAPAGSDALRAADGRLDDRARGADGTRQAADRRRHLQPAARRHSPGHRRHDLLRRGAAEKDRHVYEGIEPIAAEDRLAVQHAHPQTPSPDPDLQSRTGLDRSRRTSLARGLSLLRRRRRRVWRADLLYHLCRVPEERLRLRGGRQEERRAVPHPAPQVMRRLGVLGWPVAHSRSPAIHNAALSSLGMDDWRYQRLPVPPERLVETTRALGQSGFVGANVTIPHKQAALALADSASDAASAIGAANTLTFAPDGSIAAENTDAPGLIAALGESPRGARALVLGAGGSARAAAWALREAG